MDNSEETGTRKKERIERKEENLLHSFPSSSPDDIPQSLHEAMTGKLKGGGDSSLLSHLSSPIGDPPPSYKPLSIARKNQLRTFGQQEFVTASNPHTAAIAQAIITLSAEIEYLDDRLDAANGKTAFYREMMVELIARYHKETGKSLHITLPEE